MAFSTAALRQRANMLATARTFFSARGVVEVDTPMLTRCAPVDVHIDLVTATYNGNERCYLQSSPEYAMKRLLVDGAGDIYQLSHVFRDGESGALHNPEFTLVEWYRVGWSFQDMIDETVDFVRLFVGDFGVEQISYRDALKRYVGLDYVRASDEQLRSCARDLGASDVSGSRDDLLNYILALAVEPKLGQESICVLSHYPATQAALARKTQIDDEEVAERFEVYVRGVELANGYHELADAKEQAGRFEEANEQRVELGKELLPVDHAFLSALEQGLPDCCGVAVGFDRLLMLQAGASSLEDVTPFTF